MPTGYTPAYQILKDGLDITGRFNDRTTAISVVCASQGNGDLCTITIDDRDWAVARPDVGTKLSLSLGYKEVGLAPFGAFEIFEVTFLWTPRAIQLRGSSVSFLDTLKAPQIKEYENKTLGEIFGAIGQQGNLSVKVHPSVAGQKVQYLNQVTSSLHLMQELERRYGLIAKVADGKLSVVPKDSGQTASGQDMQTIVLREPHFGTGSVRHVTRPSFTKVRASYLDPDTNMRKFVEQAIPGAAGIVGQEIPHTIGPMFRNEADAKAAAQSQSFALSNASALLECTLAKGDPWIRDQNKVLVAGMRDGIDGSYVTFNVSHGYTKEQGIVTTIKANPPGGGADYATIYNNATPEQRRMMFLEPGDGGLVGSVIANGLLGAVDPIVQGAINIAGVL
ncbi:phage late control D family protein [Methylobacterium sp. JK268]